MGEQRRERERGLDRFLTFVDAVVAIAITLLVLPLVELTGDVGVDGSVADLLRGTPRSWGRSCSASSSSPSCGSPSTG